LPEPDLSGHARRRRRFFKVRVEDGRRQAHSEHFWQRPASRSELSETISRSAFKKRGFKFVGPVIVYAWMQATGIVNDHSEHCFRRNAKKPRNRRNDVLVSCQIAVELPLQDFMKKILLLWLSWRCRSLARPIRGAATQRHRSLRPPCQSLDSAAERGQSLRQRHCHQRRDTISAAAALWRYHLEIDAPGFADVSEKYRDSLPSPCIYAIQLKLVIGAAIRDGHRTRTRLIDPDQAGSVDQVGGNLIQDRLNSIPGRSLQDLVNSQPGWLYEGNAVLHPRGSEYQTQFVVDGIPLTDNRSPSFGPEIEADDVQSMSIYTAGIPAEYGRKMGGVVEINTLQDSQAGFHGQVVLSGGSFDTAGAFAQGQYVWGKNTLGAAAAAASPTTISIPWSRRISPTPARKATSPSTTGASSLPATRSA
jgi:hypothetical protein